MQRITKDNVGDVYRSPQEAVDTAELRGYKLQRELFVDSSGWGLESEPALTARGLEAELQELVKEHGTVYTAITGAGQFQVYVGVFTKDGERKARRLGHKTYRVELEGGHAIRYHDTNVVTYQGGKCILDTGGWYTRTTKDRMNKYAPSRYSVHQKAGEWYVHDATTGTTVPYYDGMTLEA